MHFIFVFQMFGKDFNLDILLNAIKTARPDTVILGAHHYVQLSEYDVSKTVTMQDLDSVSKIFPAGSAVPSICEANLKRKFPSLIEVVNGYGQTEAGIISVGIDNRHVTNSNATLTLVSIEVPFLYLISNLFT